MEGIFLEFENENALRSYPFAAGCVPPENPDYLIPPGIFVDAAIYPVNPSGTVYLSSISEDGVFSVSDDNGVIMTGSPSGNLVEMFDVSSFKRHVGTIVAQSEEALSEFAGRGLLREYSASEASFSASCIFPVVIDGVVSVKIGEDSPVAGSLSFENGPSEDVRVSSGTTEEGLKTLRFDVLPRPSIPDDLSIRRIICVVDGQTPFRIERDARLYNSIILTLAGIDKDDICAAAHRENSFEMADTCACDGKCSPDIPSKEPVPETYQILEVYIPPDSNGDQGGLPEGTRNSFYLVVPNELGYANPLSITMEDGDIEPKTTDFEVVVDGNNAEIAEGELLDKVGSKGIVLQVPGLSGGQI